MAVVDNKTSLYRSLSVRNSSCLNSGGEGEGRGDSHIKWTGVLVLLFRGYKSGFGAS